MISEWANIIKMNDKEYAMVKEVMPNVLFSSQIPTGRNLGNS